MRTAAKHLLRAYNVPLLVRTWPSYWLKAAGPALSACEVIVIVALSTFYKLPYLLLTTSPRERKLWQKMGNLVVEGAGRLPRQSRDRILGKDSDHHPVPTQH